MFCKVLLISMLAIIVGGDYVALQKQVQKSGVNFNCQSHVETTRDGKLKIVNSIKNNYSRPLSVDWAEAGITCTLSKQLKPGETDFNDSIAQKPYILDHSEILYGNALQYSEETRCYVDEQTRPKKRAQTERRRRDQTGTQVFGIVVASELSEHADSAVVTLRVEGDDLSLILPTRIGEEFEKFGVPKGSQDWKITRTRSLSEVDIQKESQRDLLNWLHRTPQFKSSGAPADFVVLRNRLRGNNEISFPITGSNWVLQTVYIAAFTPGKLGFVGLAADVYLPR